MEFWRFNGNEFWWAYNETPRDLDAHQLVENETTQKWMCFQLNLSSILLFAEHRKYWCNFRNNNNNEKIAQSMRR